ncbi:hypothetical protein GCM10010218_43840 [Streptomyces mashuensis]|uniref:Uncharacterized protein n=1 Tax=Streptomyces mashuensis TaxID=33904 RepID=A0A919EDM7_9ACTN|nr:hypothetical protein [Streptomyces mashuensis]GHF57663.1 hypothetical protein GCM10010218_43840 [Streptomyces mashuensis]
MTHVNSGAWAEALAPYELRYTFAAVGPRRHDDWAFDAAAVMAREVTDPRGWKRLEPAEGEEEWLEDRSYPFAGLPRDAEQASAWRSRLIAIPDTEAKKLLVALSTNWLDVTQERDFESRKADLERRASVVLSRFGASSSFYTNTNENGEVPDCYAPITGCNPFSVHGWDIGLIVVSDTEVGVFWSFDAT